MIGSGLQWNDAVHQAYVWFYYIRNGKNSNDEENVDAQLSGCAKAHIENRDRARKKRIFL